MMIKILVPSFLCFFLSFGLFAQKGDTAELFKRKQAEESIVLLKNDSHLIPIQQLENNTIALFSTNTTPNYFEKQLLKYAQITVVDSKNSQNSKISIGIIPLYTIEDIKHLKTSKNQILICFSKEVLTALLETKNTYNSLIYIPNNNQYAQEYAAQLIFGGFATYGKLKDSMAIYPKGVGLATQQIRLKYTIPEEVEMNSHFINTKIDSIMTSAIQQYAFPGAQLLVAKDNKVIFHKTYGFHTYDSIQKVTKDDIYDLASVTKITAPLPALMKLVDEGKLNIDQPFSNYWSSWKHKKTKKNLTIREILAHQAGLEPYIVFLSKVMRKEKLKKRFISTHQSKKYPIKAYEHIFVSKKFASKMYRIIKRSKVSSTKKYKYSGLSFLIYPKLIAQLTGKSYRTYLQEQFYRPLGAYTMGFTPVNKKFKSKIVPTELDTLFRKTVVKGWVHDENAALLGGISGNAGLFASATDLAKLMQLYVQKGNYGGKRYIQESTFNEFTKVQYPENENRRGLGFDKPLLDNASLSIKEAYPAPEVSSESFGHAGFTGTFIWADPKNQLVFIFLSNRVNPTRTHRNLYTLRVRQALQQVFYQKNK